MEYAYKDKTIRVGEIYDFDHRDRQWCTIAKSKILGTQTRLKLKCLPFRWTKAEAEADLKAFAEKRNLEIVG